MLIIADGDNMNNVYKILMKTSNKKIISDPNLNVWKNRKSKVKIINKCPYCEAQDIIKYGMYKSNQRYKCKDEQCGRTFTSEFYNEFRYSKKFKENCDKYFELLNNGLTIRECATKLNITTVTAFFWRHRLLYYIKCKNYIEKINSYVELTKMIVRENFKGSREIYEEKRDSIIVINAVNESLDIMPIIAARNFLGFYEIRDNLIPKLDKRAYVVGLIDGRLKTFAKAFNEINKVEIRENNGENIDIRYSIKTLKWLSKFRGVATKYLENYLAWRLFEYKSSFEIKKEVLGIEKIENNECLKQKINTYISWKNIKSTKLEA